MAIEAFGRRQITHVSNARPLVVRADRVLVGDGSPPMQDGAVVVEGRRMTYVGSATTAPRVPGAEVMDYPGATLLPGLFDLHAHLMGWEGNYWDEHRLWTGPERKLHVFRAAESAAAWLASGYTTVRDVAVNNPAVALRQAITAGVIDGPRVIAGVAALGQTGGHADSFAFPLAWQYNWTLAGSPTLTPTADWVKFGGGTKGLMVDGRDNIRRAMRALRREGADYVKFFLDHLGSEAEAEFSDDEIEVVVDEAHRRGMHVTGHALTVTAMRRAIEHGFDSVEHGTPDAPDELLHLMASRGITLVPTIGGRRAWSIDDTPIERQTAEQRRFGQWLGLLRRAMPLGVTIVPASGVGAYSSDHGIYAQELEIMVMAGMSPQQAIEAQSRFAARVCRIDHLLGTLEVGKYADMIVVDGDPLSDVRLMRSPGPLAVFTTSREENPS